MFINLTTPESALLQGAVKIHHSTGNRYMKAGKRVLEIDIAGSGFNQARREHNGLGGKVDAKAIANAKVKDPALLEALELQYGKPEPNIINGKTGLDDIHINMSGHSRGGVGCGEGMREIQTWLQSPPQNKYKDKIHFHIIQMDPVPGLGSWNDHPRIDYSKEPNTDGTVIHLPPSILINSSHLRKYMVPEE